ncbi:MAG: endonuclease/exonuclease/phosphatase family protein [Clostridia bacterium]|nr:endonuclease/exonuclease/phosphatase family protein [Clostridia bacterium]
MKVMTFNIQHCLDYKKRKIDCDLFARKITEYGADFCGLNEVRGKGFLVGYTDQIKKLSGKTGMYGYFGQAIKVKGFGPYGNGFLSKRPFKLAEVIMIPDPEIKDEKEHYETRCVIKAVMEEKGRDILFLVTHMGLAKAERKNAVEVICQIADSSDMPIVLMGDFNAVPDEETLKPLFERFSDTLKGKDVKTFPSDCPEIKIDYILYRGLECKNTKVINEVVSDHLPIITEVIV